MDYEEKMSLLGTELSADARREALAKYVHRWTVENCRAHPRVLADGRAGGNRLALTTDAEWLARTRFRVTKNGELDQRVKFCNSSADGVLVIRSGVPMDERLKADAQALACVPPGSESPTSAMIGLRAGKLSDIYFPLSEASPDSWSTAGRDARTDSAAGPVVPRVYDWNWRPGVTKVYTYQSGTVAPLSTRKRSGQSVTIVEALPDERYRVRFSDGYQSTVPQSELTATTAEPDVPVGAPRAAPTPIPDPVCAAGAHDDVETACGALRSDCYGYVTVMNAADLSKVTCPECKDKAAGWFEDTPRGRTPPTRTWIKNVAGDAWTHNDERIEDGLESETRAAARECMRAANYMERHAGLYAAAPALAAALKNLRAVHGNCGSPREQEAADMADAALALVPKTKKRKVTR